jgi:serine/threonine protein phosphatase PrpC
MVCLTRISKDHSYVQSLLDRGEITEEESFDHPEGSVITAHIGYPKLKLRDVFLRLFAPGDKLLLVSDGVTDMLRDAEYEPHINMKTPLMCVVLSSMRAMPQAAPITSLWFVCSSHKPFRCLAGRSLGGNHATSATT